jgi:hypothetical protein
MIVSAAAPLSRAAAMMRSSSSIAVWRRAAGVIWDLDQFAREKKEEK